MIDITKIKRLPPTYYNDPELRKVDKKTYFENIKKLVDERGLDNIVWAFIINNEDKIQAIGTAIIAFGNRYSDYKKYIVQALGYVVKYSGWYIDKKVMTYDEFKKGKK